MEETRNLPFLPTVSSGRGANWGGRVVVGGGDEGDGADGGTSDPCVTVEVALLASFVVVVGRGVPIEVV
jgi:hypothetical protein